MKLAFRPTKLKIKVGVIADAALGPFPEVMRPDSTWERNDNGPECMHPYKFMWNLIGHTKNLCWPSLRFMPLFSH